MLDQFLFVGLPYIAIASLIVVTAYRLRSRSFTQTALSSQFLEGNQLVWGSMPWHIGIGFILLAHLLALFFPSLWHGLMVNPIILLLTETAGFALGILALVGLLVLIYRRTTSSRIQAVTTVMDLVILLILIGQILLGLVSAVSCRWGALWSTATAVPYIWSLLTLQPDSAYVANLPVVMKAHIVGGWLILLLLPFSRLIHAFALPLEYLFREPQKVVWNNPRRQEGMQATQAVEEQQARRYFLRGSLGLIAGGALLSIGAADKFVRFFFGPRLSRHEEAKLMASKVQSLETTMEQKKYELERQQSDYIFVSKVSDLSPTKGKYFIDYNMAPALAFLNKDGLPLLLSAKCTHLGCTVGGEANAEGKILCPCHVSYFDIYSGKPNPDAPAKLPLAHLGWVVMDAQGKVVLSKKPEESVVGQADPDQIKEYSVFIAKYLKEQA